MLARLVCRATPHNGLIVGSLPRIAVRSQNTTVWGRNRAVGLTRPQVWQCQRLSTVSEPSSGQVIQAKERMPHQVRPPISTLDPSKYTPQEILDLSGYQTKYFSFSGLLHLRYRVWYKSFGEIPFPPGTKGILYFHDRSNAHPLAGDIRFRVLPLDTVQDWNSVDTAELFARGHDLLDYTGLSPWRISLVSVIHSDAHGLYDFMKTQGYIVGEAELAVHALQHALSRAPEAKPRRRVQRQVLDRVTDPFILDLYKDREVLLVLAEEGIVPRAVFPRQNTNVRVNERCRSQTSYSGTVLVRFEMIREASRNWVVMRVLKSLKHPNPKDAVTQT